jgi:putative NADH-flavin reductase
MVFHSPPSSENNNAQKSVLVIGATGRTGIECIKELSSHDSKPQVHAFCRNASKLEGSLKDLCASIVEGDAKSEVDIERSLSMTKADVIIVSIGNGDNVGKSDIRTVSAQAVAKVMEKPEFQHVHAMIVSSAGAGTSRIIVGFGIGSLISYHLKNILKDHTGQEQTFLSVHDLQKRTCIVRATALVDNKATGKVVAYGDTDKAPSIETDRADLAAWITKQICRKYGSFGGKVVNLTGVKK